MKKVTSYDITDRCNAMINLAWMRNPDKLPVILEYYRKPSLSVHEKAAVATALMIYGTTDYDLHLAILGLATIGTEEAMQLVLNLPPEKNRYSPKPARWNFDCFNININERR